MRSYTATLPHCAWSLVEPQLQRVGVGLGGVAWGLAVPAACLLREEVA